MSDELILTNVVTKLRRATQDGTLSRVAVTEATADIAAIRVYDQERFPKLQNTTWFTDTSGATPTNLAEALLWKLGKWNVYKKFAANYTAELPNPTRTDVVLFAFVKHLKDDTNPIYDQHALRALWAICGNFTEPDQAICKSVLVDGKGHWKQTGSGNDTLECYELFLKHLKALLSGDDPPTLQELNRLLMPLGQALKRTAKPYAKFCQVCGLSITA